MDGASPSNFLSKGEEAVLHYKYKHYIFHFGYKQSSTFFVQLQSPPLRGGFR